MPRKRKSPGSGGARVGAPGQAYGNRVDMNQPVTVASGQTYGSRQQQVDAQRAIPLPAASAPPPAPQAGTVAAGPTVTPLSAPTTMPNQPVTHGLPIGPGAGPEVLGLPSAGDNVLDELRGIFAAYPTPELATLIDQLRAEGKS